MLWTLKDRKRKKEKKALDTLHLVFFYKKRGGGYRFGMRGAGEVRKYGDLNATIKRKKSKKGKKRFVQSLSVDCSERT